MKEKDGLVQSPCKKKKRKRKTMERLNDVKKESEKKKNEENKKNEEKIK